MVSGDGDIDRRRLGSFRTVELAGHRDGVKAVVWEAWVDGKSMGLRWLGTTVRSRGHGAAARHGWATRLGSGLASSGRWDHRQREVGGGDFGFASLAVFGDCGFVV